MKKREREVGLIPLSFCVRSVDIIRCLLCLLAAHRRGQAHLVLRDSHVRGVRSGDGNAGQSLGRRRYKQTPLVVLPKWRARAHEPGLQVTLKLDGVSSQCISDKSGVTSSMPDDLCGTASH